MVSMRPPSTRLGSTFSTPHGRVVATEEEEEEEEQTTSSEEEEEEVIGAPVLLDIWTRFSKDTGSCHVCQPSEHCLLREQVVLKEEEEEEEEKEEEEKEEEEKE